MFQQLTTIFEAMGLKVIVSVEEGFGPNGDCCKITYSNGEWEIYYGFVAENGAWCPDMDDQGNWLICEIPF